MGEAGREAKQQLQTLLRLLLEVYLLFYMPQATELMETTRDSIQDFCSKVWKHFNKEG